MKPLCLFTEKQYSRNERHYSNGIDMHIWCGSLIVLLSVQITYDRFWICDLIMIHIQQELLELIITLKKAFVKS